MPDQGMDGSRGEFKSAADKKRRKIVVPARSNSLVVASSGDSASVSLAYGRAVHEPGRYESAVARAIHIRFAFR